MSLLLEPHKTAVLTLDLQRGVFGILTNAAESIIPLASRATQFARDNNYHLFHVGLGFSPGHPEIKDGDSAFADLKTHGMFLVGSDSAQVHPSIAEPNEPVIHKQRFCAFSENALHLILRSKGIENLVLFGAITSGVVLSTLRRAYDLDYNCNILKDACFDPDAEVHRILTEKILAAQAKVLAVSEFTSA